METVKKFSLALLSTVTSFFSRNEEKVFNAIIVAWAISFYGTFLYVGYTLYTLHSYIEGTNKRITILTVPLSYSDFRVSLVDKGVEFRIAKNTQRINIALEKGELVKTR